MDTRRRRPTGPLPWGLAFTGMVVGAIIVFAVAWGWTQRVSAHSQQILELQRGGNQSAALRFCLGVSQVGSGVGRAEVAIAQQNEEDFTLAVESIKDGYSVARRASHYVPSASVSELAAPRNALVKAVDAADDGIPEAAVIRAELLKLRTGAAASAFNAQCRNVLSADRARS